MGDVQVGEEMFRGQSSGFGGGSGQGSGGGAGGYREDRARLEKFLRELRAFIEVAIDDPAQLHLALDETLQDEASAAWAQTLPQWESLVAAVHTVPDAALEAHGLHDDALKFKLSVLERNRQSVADNPISWGIRKLFSQLDVILDSLIGATGVGGAVKEIKDSLGNLVKE